MWNLLVRLIHLVFVLFMILIPFTHAHEYLLLHSILVPFLFFHWITNNDTCALTELEKLLSNKTNSEDTFIGSIISPIYKIESSKMHCNLKKFTKISLILLWALSLEKI